MSAHSQATLLVDRSPTIASAIPLGFHCLFLSLPSISPLLPSPPLVSLLATLPLPFLASSRLLGTYTFTNFSQLSLPLPFVAHKLMVFPFRISSLSQPPKRLHVGLGVEAREGRGESGLDLG